MAYSEYTPNPEAEIDASLDNEKILTSLTSLLTTPDQQVKAKPLLPLVLHINGLWDVQPENQSKYAKLFTDFLTSSDFSTAEKDANIFTILENRTNNNTALDASTKRYLATKINSFKEDPMKYEQKYTAELMKYMPNLYLAALKEDIEKTVKAELEKLVLINGGKVDLSDIKVSPDGKIYTFKATLKEMPDEAKNLNGLALDLQVQRLFENQKTLMQITKVIYPAEHSGIKLEANQQYLFLNGLQAFEIKGALANKTRTPVKQEQLFYTYDKEKTEERIRENLSQKSFSFEYDKSAFTKNKLPLTMGDVDIDALFEQIKLDKEVKTEDGKQFSRQLRFVDGTTYKNIPEGKITWDFDTEKVTLKPNESTLKTINLFGKDFTITIENDEKNGVKIKMDSAESTKLSEWMATIWESHIDVLTETNTGDSKEYENLKKSEYKRTKEDVQRPRYNTQSTQLSLARGVVVNVTNAQKGKEFFVALAPDGSSTPIEGTNKEKAHFQILDAYNRQVSEYFLQRPGHEKTNTVTHVAIENDKLSILEARDKSTFKEYHYLTIKEGATPAPWFIKNEKSATASSLNVLDGKNSPLLDNDLKIKSDPKKGYEFLEKENEVTLKAEHFHNQLKTIIKPDAYTALNLSENDIRTVFDTQFAKLYPNGLKKQGILKDGEYYQLTVNKGAKWEATVKSPKESVPANLQELMNNMHAYLKASVALRAKKPQYTRLSEGEIKSKAKTTNTPESSDWTNFISGAWGSDVFMVEGFTQFDVQKKDQKVELVILDGKNERIIIPFSRTASSGLKLQKDIVSTGGQVYNITYQGDQLYVFPAKDKKK